jgi:hypothetical protein
VAMLAMVEVVEVVGEVGGGGSSGTCTCWLRLPALDQQPLSPTSLLPCDYEPKK